MLVKYWMSTPAVTVGAEDTLEEADRRFAQHGLRMLPVLAGGRLAGVITRAGLARAAASGPGAKATRGRTAAVARVRVKSAMIPDPVRIPLYHTVEEAAVVLVARGVRATPVTDPAGGVAGVVSRTDLLRALVRRIGVHPNGVRVALRAEDRPGVVAEVADLIERHGGRIASILTRGGPAGDEALELYLRVHAPTPAAQKRLNNVLRAQAGVIFVVDHAAAERTIDPETPPGAATAYGPVRSRGAIEKGGNR
jgi:acetoin utilization protein AcuB